MAWRDAYMIDIEIVRVKVIFEFAAVHFGTTLRSISVAVCSRASAIRQRQVFLRGGNVH